MFRRQRRRPAVRTGRRIDSRPATLIVAASTPAGRQAGCPPPGKDPPPCRPPTAADRIRCKPFRSAFLTTRPPPLTIGGREFVWGRRTYVMGVLNITLDSFSGDGLGYDVEAAVAQGRRFAAEGADILDVGGESTRPQFR